MLRDGSFENIWVQPAAGDAGGALGAVYAAWNLELDHERQLTQRDGMKGSYLGPAFSIESIQEELQQAGAVFEVHSTNETLEKTAQALEEGKAIGWFQGRMEFGPRSLGARSIIADPRSESMQKKLNLKVKFRESFRPFAPAILREDLNEWFDINSDSPYMLLVADVQKHRQKKISPEEEALFGMEKLNIKRSDIPAVTHVDYSARIQTVHKDTNHRFHQLISRFKARTNCPVIVNTSFNVRGEPIVCSPTDAFNCFMGTDLDVLVVENCFLEKSKQTQDLFKDYKNQFKLD